MAPDDRMRRPPDVVIPPEERIPRARSAPHASTSAAPTVQVPLVRDSRGRGLGRGRGRGRGRAHRFVPYLARGPPPPPPAISPPTVRASKMQCGKAAVSRDPRKRPEHLKRRSEAAVPVSPVISHPSYAKPARPATNSPPISTAIPRSKRSPCFTSSPPMIPDSQPSASQPLASQLSQSTISAQQQQELSAARPVPIVQMESHGNNGPGDGSSASEPVASIPKTKSKRKAQLTPKAFPTQALPPKASPSKATAIAAAAAASRSNAMMSSVQLGKSPSSSAASDRVPELNSQKVVQLSGGHIVYTHQGKPAAPAKQIDNRMPLPKLMPAKASIESLPAKLVEQVVSPQIQIAKSASWSSNRPASKITVNMTIPRSGSSEGMAARDGQIMSYSPASKSLVASLPGHTRSSSRKTSKSRQPNISPKRSVRTVQSANYASKNANTTTPVGNAKPTSPLNSVHPPKSAAKSKPHLSTHQILSQAAASLEIFKNTCEVAAVKGARQSLLPKPSRTGAMNETQPLPARNLPEASQHSTVSAAVQSARQVVLPTASGGALHGGPGFVPPAATKNRTDGSSLNPAPKVQSAELRARIERDRRLQVRRSAVPSPSGSRSVGIPVRRRSMARNTPLAKAAVLSKDVQSIENQPLQSATVTSNIRQSTDQCVQSAMVPKSQVQQQSVVEPQLQFSKSSNQMTPVSAVPPLRRTRTELHTRPTDLRSPAPVHPQNYSQSPTAQLHSAHVQLAQSRQSQTIGRPHVQTHQAQTFSSASHQRDIVHRATPHINSVVARPSTLQPRHYTSPRASNVPASFPAPGPRAFEHIPQASYSQAPAPITPLQLHTARARASAAALAQNARSQKLLQAQTAAQNGRMQLAASIPNPQQAYIMPPQTGTHRPIQTGTSAHYQTPQPHRTTLVRTGVQLHPQTPRRVPGRVSDAVTTHAAHHAQLAPTVQHQHQIQVTKEFSKPPGQVYVTPTMQIPPRTGFHAPTISRLPQASKAQIKSGNVVLPRTSQQVNPSQRLSPRSSVHLRSPPIMNAQPVRTPQSQLLSNQQSQNVKISSTQLVQPRVPIQAIKQQPQLQSRHLQENHSSPQVGRPIQQDRRKPTQPQPSRTQSKPRAVQQPASSPQPTSSCASPSVPHISSPAVSAPVLPASSTHPPTLTVSNPAPGVSRPPISSPDVPSTLPTGPPPKHPKRSTGRPRGRPRGSKAKPGSRPRGRPRKNAGPPSPATLPTPSTASSPGSETPSEPDSVSAAKPKRGRPKSQKTNEKLRQEQERKMSEEKLLDSHERKINHMMAMNVKKRWRAEYFVHKESDEPCIEPLTKRQRISSLEVQPVPAVAVALAGASVLGGSWPPVNPLTFANLSVLSFSVTPVPRHMPSSKLSAASPAKLSLDVAPKHPPPTSSLLAMASPARLALAVTPAPREITRPSFAALDVAPTPRRIAQKPIPTSQSALHDNLRPVQQNLFDNNSPTHVDAKGPKPLGAVLQKTSAVQDMEISPVVKTADNAQLETASGKIDSILLLSPLKNDNMNVDTNDANMIVEASAKKKENVPVVSKRGERLSLTACKDLQASHQKSLPSRKINMDVSNPARYPSPATVKGKIEQGDVLLQGHAEQPRNLKLSAVLAVKPAKSKAVSEKSVMQQGEKELKKRLFPVSLKVHKRSRMEKTVNIMPLPAAKMLDAGSGSVDTVGPEPQKAKLVLPGKNNVKVANSVLPERNAQQELFNCLCDEEFEVVPSHLIEEINREVNTGVGAGTIPPLDFWRWRLLCHHLCCPNANKPTACPRRSALLVQFERTDFNEVLFST